MNNINKFNKKEIMELAWKIYNQGAYTRAEALKTAWECFKKSKIFKDKCVK